MQVRVNKTKHLHDMATGIVCVTFYNNLLGYLLLRVHEEEGVIRVQWITCEC